MGISNANFLARNYIFDESHFSNGSIINQGMINAEEYGLAALIGASVSNEGTMRVHLGHIILASGSAFTFNFSGDGLLNFVVNSPAAQQGIDEQGNPLKNAVNQSGILSANGGVITITARTAQSVLDNAINMQGVAIANSVSTNNGMIILSAEPNATVHVAGALEASGKNAGERGGVIKITGGYLSLDAGTSVDTSGASGGGEILIGGNAHGLGPEQNAIFTLINKDVSLNANALELGDGGKIIVWANDATGFYGSAVARGGMLGGDGGFIETSGLKYLDTQGAYVDLRAPLGKTGTWLIDPVNITICDACTTTNLTLSSNTYNSGLISITNATLNSGDLGTALNNANIAVTTSNVVGLGAGDITVSGVTGLQTNWNTGNTNTLTLQADRHIIFNTGLTLSGTGKSVNLNASGNITLNNSMNGGFNLSATTATGAITTSQALGATTALNSTSFNASTITLGAGVTTSGSQSYAASSGTTNALQLNGTYTTNNATFSASGNTQLAGSTTVNTSGGSVAFSNAVTGAVANTQDLTISSGGGNTGFSSTINGLRNLAVTSAGAISFSGVIGGTTPLTSMSVNGGGTATVNGNVNTSGAQTWANAITLNQNTIFTSSANDISLTDIAGGGRTLTINNAGNASVISGAISNIASLTKQGVGTLNLAGNNTYTSATVVSAGTLQVSSATGLGTTASGTTVASGAILDINNVVIGAEALTLNTAKLSGTGTSSLSGNISLGGHSSFGGTGSLTLNGAISGAFNISKVDAGTVNLTVASTFSGSTSINNGTLQVSQSNALSGTSSTTVNSGGTLDVNNVTISNDLTLAGGALTATGSAGVSGNITMTAGSTFGGTGTLALSGILGESGGSRTVTKTGTGTLSLLSSNTYTGATTINAGTMSLAHANALGNFTIGPTINSGGTLNLNSLALTLGNGITLGLNGNGALGVGALTATGTASVTGTGAVSLAGNTTIGGAGALTLNVPITGNFSVTKNGAGTLDLTTASTYNGETTISAGTLALMHSTAAGTGTITVANGAALALNGNGLSINNALILNGTGISNTGALVDSSVGTAANRYAGTINLATDTAIGVTSSSVTLTLGNVVSGSGALSKVGSGTLVLENTNTYTGATTVNAGTLQAAANNVLPDNTALTVAAGAFFALNGFSDTLGALSGNGTVALGSGALTVGNDATSTTFAGTLTGTGSLSKIGSGTLTLAGTNLFSGGTTINNGVVSLLSNAAAGSGTITVANGAALALNGNGLSINNALILNGTGISNTGALVDSSVGTAANRYAGTINLATDTAIGVTSSSVTLTLGNVVSGSGALSKVGSGTLVFESTVPSAQSADVPSPLDTNLNNPNNSTSISNTDMLVSADELTRNIIKSAQILSVDNESLGNSNNMSIDIKNSNDVLTFLTSNDEVISSNDRSISIDTLEGDVNNTSAAYSSNVLAMSRRTTSEKNIPRDINDLFFYSTQVILMMNAPSGSQLMIQKMNFTFNKKYRYGYKKIKWIKEKNYIEQSDKILI